MKYFVAITVWVVALWLIRRDVRQRRRLSPAIWIPTLWAAILLSRPLPVWLGFGGAVNASEGSLLNQVFFLGLAILSLGVLTKRGLAWGKLIAVNWPLFLIYGYLLLSVSWAYDPLVAFKRWFKDLSNILIALVILTERWPLEAIKAVFIRCAYIWFPLSVVFIRWFPDLGRNYRPSGGLEVTGVADQKNSLGLLVLVCGLLFLWEWLERRPSEESRQRRLDRYLPPAYLGIGAYLLYQCDSKTSILCLALGALILFAIRFDFLRARASALGVYCLVGIAALFLADWAFGLKEDALEAVGRDSTFTGRTMIWTELLSYKTNPLLGVGFLSLWDDPAYASQFPRWMPRTAHNGYLEMYLDGGLVGVGLLVLLLTVTFFRLHRALASKSNYAIFCFAVLLVIVLASYSESHFFRMGAIWFLFVIVVLSPKSLFGQRSALSKPPRKTVAASFS